MHIKPIKIYSPKTQVSFEGKLSFKSIFHKDKQADSFERTNISPSENVRSYPFSGEKDFKEYMDLSQEEKDESYENITLSIKEAARKSVDMAEILDKKMYKGKKSENRVFVSIGTSPVGVMRAFEYMGKDVRYMPISNLLSRKEQKETIEDFIETHDLGAYYKFLSSIGLTDKEINQSEKRYIFYDYTAGGTTLDCLQRAYYHNGVSKKNTNFRSLNNDLMKIARGDEQTQKINLYIRRYFANSEIGPYSNVPHLSYYETQKIDSLLNEEENSVAKDFNYAVLHELEKRGKLKNDD